MKTQDLFDITYDVAREKGYTPEQSLMIAKETISNYKEPQEVVGKKSFAISGVNTGNTIDMIFGYPAPDVEEQMNVLKMDYSGWNKTPDRKILGDMEHFGFDLANGVKNDLHEDWQDFNVEANDWYIDDKQNLRAKVKFPDTEKGKEALRMYNTGQLGASIEYKGFNDDNTLTNWEITGFSLTKDPSYDPKGKDG